MNVIFFPRNDYPNNVEVCAHRLGKKMTYTEGTDTLPTVAQQIASLAKSNGIKCSVFASQLNNASENLFLRQSVEDGDLWADLYFCTQNTDPGEVVTQEVFENDLNTIMLPFFLQNFGKKPVTLSYANGNISYKDYAIPYFLGGRKSEVSYNTDYGVGYGSPSDVAYTKVGYIAKANSTRIYDSALPNSWNVALQNHIERIDACLQSGGWLNNFTHWHDVVNGRYGDHYDWYEEYFDVLKYYKDTGNVYFAGYGEAVAYLVYRQLITRAVMYSPLQNKNNQLVIRLEVKNTLNIDTDLLQIPISIKFSTTGTPLAGQTIKSNRNLINLGSNNYIVEIPYNKYACAVIEKVSN